MIGLLNSLFKYFGCRCDRLSLIFNANLYFLIKWLHILELENYNIK